MEQVRITVPGIKRSLKTYDFKKALAEYIWNGFDAGASRVCVEFTDNGLGGIKNLTVTDNGEGIDYHSLNNTFAPFFESQKDFDAKVDKKRTSAVRGKNGVGRLTFFKFSNIARWHTVFGNGKGNQQYTITVESDTLDKFERSDLQFSEKETGTTVEFGDLFDVTVFQFSEEVLFYLKQEFGWFLALNQPRNFQLLINNEPLDFEGIVGEIDRLEIQIERFAFFVRYIRWGALINKEYSRFYFIGSDHKERFKEATTFNNKGDSFYHSLFITSVYFDDPAHTSPPSEIDETIQPQLAGLERSDKIFRELVTRLNEYLRAKRLPFLRASADRLIEHFERDKVFPIYRKNEWDIARHTQLQEFVRGLYQVEPKIFQNLSLEQKKTFTHLLNLIMAQGEREHLLEVLREIIDLSPDELRMLADILKSSRLSGVIKTIRLIEDRYRAVEQLRALVFKTELKANEPDHIQKMVEHHYWLFGEQYHLVTAAEQKFEKALRRYVTLLYGKTSKRTINHPDKYKEMDIFMVRQLMLGDQKINNVVVELKNPRVRLGAKELQQVKTYMSVILEQHEFNASNMFWEFYLVGNEFDSYIELELENAKSHGERSLVFRSGRYKIYVKTWSEIFADFELRHKFMMDKLQIERDKLVVETDSAEDVIQDQVTNSAAQPSILKPTNFTGSFPN